MSRTSSLGQWTGLPVLADAADITAVGTTMADNIEKQVNLRYATTIARDAAITSPVRGMVAYIDADNSRYIYTGSVWTLMEGPAHGAWTTYVPTLTQTSVPTFTVNYAAFMRMGRGIFGNVRLTLTATPGTAGGTVIGSLPVTAAAGVVSTAVGSADVLDASTSTTYGAVTVPVSTTTVALLPGGGVNNYLGSAQFTAALAVGDVVTYSFHYEAAAD